MDPPHPERCLGQHSLPVFLALAHIEAWRGAIVAEKTQSELPGRPNRCHGTHHMRPAGKGPGLAEGKDQDPDGSQRG